MWNPGAYACCSLVSICVLIRIHSVSCFFSVGAKNAGERSGDDRIREGLWSKSNKEKGHETFPKLSERNQTVVSTRGARVLGVSSHAARGRGGVQTHCDYAGRSD